MTLSTSVGTGVWQPALVAGTGVWTPSGLNNGLATYQWTGGESSFTVRLVQSAAVSLSVNLSDGFVLEDPTEDPTITFTTSALRITMGLLPGMVAKKKGHIVNISSISVLVNAPRFMLFLSASCAVGKFTDPTVAALGKALLASTTGGASPTSRRLCLCLAGS